MKLKEDAVNLKSKRRLKPQAPVHPNLRNTPPSLLADLNASDTFRAVFSTL
uniref:Uncharacterized protein n=1 Tax=Setaria italica TaxID=4555 RepID=K4A3L7_SETIT